MKIDSKVDNIKMFDKKSYRLFPQRNELMSLSTITKRDMSPRRKTWIRSISNSLRTDDISGATPRPSVNHHIEKPLQVAERTKSKSSSLQKPFFSLMTSDIEQAQPKLQYFKTPRSGHNPLNPYYKLPSFTKPPPTPPKFLRDTLDLSDLNQRSPRPVRQEHDLMNVSDIHGTQGKTPSKLIKPSFYCPKDINHGEELLEIPRLTNPLSPEYSVRDENGKLVTIGDIEGNKPQVYSPFVTKGYPRSLATDDIEGASPRNLLPSINKPSAEPIEGSVAGTLRKGIRTDRVTHPLDPEYKWKVEETPKSPLKQGIFPAGSSFSEQVTEISKINSKANSMPVIRTDNFDRNSQLFFGQTPRETPRMQKYALKASAEKFFENGQRRTHDKFQNLHKGSIHRMKERKPIQSEGFLEDCAKFFEHSRSSSQKSNYKFGLTRNKIQQPVIKYN